MSITFRPGVLPNNPDKPRLRIGRYFTGGPLAPPPKAVDWDKAVGSWPIYANDRYGCCVWSACGHMIQTWTANASTEIDVSVSALLQGYSDVTGFDPDDPATDQGTVLQDALGYWRTAGIDGHKILAFAQVDHTSLVELEAAAALFGDVLFAVDFPDSAMDQFNEGKPWDVAVGAQSEGGHAVCAGRYDTASTAAPWTVITWGREQQVTTHFLSRYLREAWIAVAPEWIRVNGSTPAGLNLAAMGQDFTILTGEPAPWAGPTPPPEPPSPHPSSLDVAVQALVSSEAVAAWLRATHSGLPKKVAALVRAVVDVSAER